MISKEGEGGKKRNEREQEVPSHHHYRDVEWEKRERERETAWGEFAWCSGHVLSAGVDIGASSGGCYE